MPAHAGSRALRPLIVLLMALVLAGTALAESRHALVIGNDRYLNFPRDKQLQKAVNDSIAVGDALEKLGFEVIRGRDLGRQAVIDRLADLTARLQPGDTVAFFYAGHGVSIGGVNYLVPSDVPAVAEGSEARVRGASIAEPDIIAELQAKGVRVALLVFDACRDNPFPRSAGRSIGSSRGLGEAARARGIFTIYSAGIGQTALDRLEPNDPARNSVFTRIFVEELKRPDVDLGGLAIEVREKVAALALKAKNEAGLPAPHEQTPAYYDQTLGGRIFLAGRTPGGETPIAKLPPPLSADEIFWLAIKDSSVAPLFDEFIKRYPASPRAEDARRRLEELRKSQVAVAPPPDVSSKLDLRERSSSSEEASSAIAEKFADAVVGIVGTKERQAAQLGSGFVIAPQGLVATCNAILVDAGDLHVALADGTRLKAEVVGRDAPTNVALLKVNPARPLKAVQLGDSTKLGIGVRVAALGSGGAALSGPITEFNFDIAMGPYDDFIKVDTVLEKVVFGGPLFSMSGEVVGIIATTLGSSEGKGLFTLAVPMALAAPVIEQLRLFGKVRRGWLGVRIQAVDDATAESLKMGAARGALVAQVDDKGPAKTAGIEPGDVIVALNGRDVKALRDLPRLVASLFPGDRAELVLFRKGREEKRSVILGSLEETPVTPAEEVKVDRKPPQNPAQRALGLHLSDLSDAARAQFKVKADVKGLLITHVDESATAAKERNLKPGTVIVEANQVEVSTVADFQKAVAQTKQAGRRSLLMRVTMPDGEIRFVALPLE